MKDIIFVSLSFYLQIRLMSDEDLREIGLTPNAVGQLRNIVKSQTSNGLSQLAGEKKVDSPNNSSNLGDRIENEVIINYLLSPVTWSN